jgi:hypothetical protein
MSARLSRLSLAATLAFLLAGCASPFQGIRFRAQAPPIDDAFRKISVALTVDGYEISSTTPGLHRVETEWRDAKEKEISPEEKALGAGNVQVRMMVRLEMRGRPFELYATPFLRYKEGDSWRESVAPVTHPLWEKWMRTLTTIVEKEVREEE